MLLHGFGIVERGTRHRRTAVFPGKLELDLARGEPLQELDGAFRVLGARGDAGDEGTDGGPVDLLFRRRGRVDLAHHLRGSRIVDALRQTGIFRQGGALALEHKLDFLVGVVFRHARGHVGDETEQAGERADPFRAGEARRPVLVDEMTAIRTQQRQIGHHDRVALHATGRPAIHAGRLRRLRHLEDIVPGLRRCREMVGVVIEDFDVIDDDDRIELGLRAGEVLHASARLRRPQPHLESLLEDVRIHLEANLVEALDDVSGCEFRHPVVVHDIDVIGTGLVEAVVLAVLIPAVVVGFVVVDRDPRLAGELLDEIVAERRHGVVLETADGDRAAGRPHDARRKDCRGAGEKRRARQPPLEDVAAAQGPLEQFVGVSGLIFHFGPPC